ncbi:unnamed protein product, partial [Prorocentrum cordatum]
GRGRGPALPGPLREGGQGLPHPAGLRLSHHGGRDVLEPVPRRGQDVLPGAVHVRDHADEHGVGGPGARDGGRPGVRGLLVRVRGCGPDQRVRRAHGGDGHQQARHGQVHAALGQSRAAHVQGGPGGRRCSPHRRLPGPPAVPAVLLAPGRPVRAGGPEAHRRRLPAVGRVRQRAGPRRLRAHARAPRGRAPQVLRDGGRAAGPL